MNERIQTDQDKINPPPTEAAPPHAKPFLAATDAPKASQASRFARWLPTPGNVIFTLLAIGLLIMTQNVWSAPSLANIPGPSATTVNYQGRLADSNGNPLSGSYNLQFAIYDAPTAGNRVWAPENHLGVPVTDGLFSVDLGSQTTGGIPTSTWDGDRYLEITVNGEPLTPRELIRSVPIAGMALTVPDGAITTDKIADGAVTSDKLATVPQKIDCFAPPGSSLFDLSTSGAWSHDLFSCPFTAPSAGFMFLSLQAHQRTHNGANLCSFSIFVNGVNINTAGRDLPSDTYITTWHPTHMADTVEVEAGTHTLSVRLKSGTTNTCGIHDPDINGIFIPTS